MKSESHNTLPGDKSDKQGSRLAPQSNQDSGVLPIMNQGSALRAPEVTHHSMVNLQTEKVQTVRLKQQVSNAEQLHLYQAAKTNQDHAITSSNTPQQKRQYGTESGSKQKQDSKQLKPQRNSSGQFIQFADRLLGAINSNLTTGEAVGQAMNDASGYNIVSSKSHKMLPLSKQNEKQVAVQRGQNNASQGSSNKYIVEQQSNLDKERMRVSQSFKSILQREQARDEQLATRLKKINEKQAARIKEIETREQRNQQDELDRLVQCTGDLSEMRPSQSQKILEPIISQHSNSAQQYSTIQIGDKESSSPDLPKTSMTQRESMVGGTDRDEHLDQLSKKEYFNNKKINQFKIKPEKELRNQSSSFTNMRAREDGNQTVSAGMTRERANGSQTYQTWGANASKITYTTARDRPDVSYLHSKNNKMVVSQNTSKNLHLDAKKQAFILSQSQLTSGNEGQDDFMQVALSLRHIGKSIMEMPKTLDDLKVLSKEYMRNIGVMDDIQDEQTYLQYIEDHLKAQEKAATQGEMKNTLSPIRNLADFYSRKLNKIQAASEAQNNKFGRSSISPVQQAKTKKYQQQNLSKYGSQAPSVNATYVDLEAMTAADMDKLERSPPRINPKRKNMKVINNKAMLLFGTDAFGVQLGDNKPEDYAEADQITNRLTSQRSSLLKSPLALHDKLKDTTQASPIDQTPRTTSKQRKMIKSSTHKDTAIVGVKKEDRAANRKKLLQSLNDLADQLTKPSITQEEQKPEWLQKNLKEEAAKMGLTQANLGKPSSRQDAVLLAKWFKGIIDMIEDEYITSKNYYAKQGMKRTFPTQKTHDTETSQADQYLLIQIAHNIAIKEITRQVSVQCIERGILLKTIFDSYVRMVDLIFVDSVAQRKVLAQRFASVCEKQVYHQAEQIRKKDEVIERKDRQIAELKVKLAQAADLESQLNFTNKKLGKVAMRANQQASDYQRMNTALERQVQYLENRIKILLDTLEPEKAAQFKKETRRTLHKIQTQADIDHAAQTQAKKAQGLDAEINEIGDVVVTYEMATDMEDFKLHLEEVQGGPLEIDQQLQTSLHMLDESNSGFDLYEVGAIEDKGTFIDPEWRKESRPKRMRAKSADDQKHDKRIEMFDDVSFDTSSHHTIDYILEDYASKSFTYGQNRNYTHVKRQRPVKRSMSAGNFNWNMLVDRVDKKVNEEEKRLAEKNAGSPMAKLISILGQELLDRIKNEIPELYEALMDYINNKKGLVTFAFCRDLLLKYNLNLEEERKKQRMQFGMQFGSQGSHIDESQDGVSMVNDDPMFNMTNASEMQETGRSKNKIGPGQGNARVSGRNNRKRDHMYQFVEWNFQRRKGAKRKPQERLRKDHPSFPIITKLMERYSSGREIKDLMAAKTAVRYIYNVYMGKAAEYANEKLAQKKQVKDRNTSVSPEKPPQKQQLETTKRESMVEKSKMTSVSPSAAQGGPGLKRAATISSPKEANTNRASGKMMKINSQLSPQGSGNENEDQKDGRQSKSPNNVVKGQDLATNVNLIEWTYEYFQNRYGLKNVADKKFNQFIGSVLKYKQKHPRFRLFGRFLGLYDELSDQDLKLYVDIVHNMFKSVLNFQIQEQDEVVLIPTGRACDYFRTTFATRLTNTSMSHCLKIIRQKQITIQKVHSEKHLHLNSYTEAVQLDDFAEFVIHTTNQLQAEKLQNIQEIFMAADLNHNSILEFNELKTLYKLLCNQYSGDRNQQMQEIRNIFNDYSKVFTNIRGSEGIKIRGISYDSFEKLCLERDVFTIRQQNSFINAATKTFLNVTDNQDTFTQEFEKLSKNLDSIHERLTSAIRDDMDSDIVPDQEKERYQDMVEQMSKAVMNPVNKKVAFLTFKIVEETVKRVCLKNEIDKLMPVLPECIASIKKSLNISNVNVEKIKSSLLGSLKGEIAQRMGQNFVSMLQPSFKESEIQLVRDDSESRSQQAADYQTKKSRQARFRGSESNTLPVDDGRNVEYLDMPYPMVSAASKLESGFEATQSFQPNKSKDE